MLVATIATPVTATAAPAMSATAAVPPFDPDAPLHEMRQALLGAFLAWDAALSRYGAAQTAFWATHGKCPGWQVPTTWKPTDGHPDGFAARDAYRAAERAAIDPLYEEAGRLGEVFDLLVDDLLSKRAQTIAGMRFKVEIAHGLFDDDLETSLAEDLMEMGGALIPWGQRIPSH